MFPRKSHMSFVFQCVSLEEGKQVESYSLHSVLITVRKKSFLMVRCSSSCLWPSSWVASCDSGRQFSGALRCHGFFNASVFWFLCIQSKIKKRSWVLHECLERVPENVDAAKELLQYGLKGTDLEALLAIGKGADNGRLVIEGFGFKSEGAFVKTF